MSSTNDESLTDQDFLKNSPTSHTNNQHGLKLKSVANAAKPSTEKTKEVNTLLDKSTVVASDVQRTRKTVADRNNDEFAKFATFMASEFHLIGDIEVARQIKRKMIIHFASCLGDVDQ